MKEQLIVTLKVEDLERIIDERLELASKKQQEVKEEQILKRTDVTKLFKISLVTLNTWMKEGRIEYHKINSRIFFKHSEVMAALKAIKRYSRK